MASAEEKERRRRRSPLQGRPNAAHLGKHVSPPPGVVAWPGPRRAIRHRGYLHVRIYVMDQTLFDPPQWVATVLAELPDVGIVATGPDAETLKLYCLERFQKVWFTIYPAGEAYSVSD